MDVGAVLLNSIGLVVSVGETGEAMGVVEAIVPPTPVLSVGEATLTFPVIEHAEGGT